MLELWARSARPVRISPRSIDNWYVSDYAGIRVDFDGHTIIDWHGDFRQLSPTWSQLRAPKRAFWIGTHCNYRIKKLELLPLTSETKE
jgi:hypothetical protein